MIGVSIVFEPVWNRIKEYLHVVPYDKDGGHPDPRIRIEFLDLPDKLGREVECVTMKCVACQRPIHPLRRREGDGYDRLYYACCCPTAIHPACSRSRSAALEYERFKSLKVASMPPRQLSLFG
jgi:hypothetical protein